MTESNELFFARQVIFVREAREACHKAQFFLGMLYEADLKKATEIIKDYIPFAMHQVKGLVKGIYIPKTWKDKAAELNPPDEATIDEEDEKTKQIRKAVKLCKQWQDMRDFLSEDKNHKFYKVPVFRDQIHNFLKDSRPEGFWGRLYHIGFPNFLSYLHKKLTFLWGALLVGFAFLFVEAINGLLRNEGWGVVWPILLVSLPTIINQSYICWRFSRKPQQLAFWDIGGHPLRSLCWLAKVPGRLVQRWSPGTPMARLILVTAAGRFLIYLAWWTLCLAVFSNIDTSMKTVFAFMVIGFLLLSAAYLVDLWDFTSKLAIRFLAILLALVCLVLFLGGADHVIFIILFWVIAAGFAYLGFRKMKRGQNWYIDLFFVVLFFLAGLATISGRATYIAEKWRDTGVQVPIPVRVQQNEWPLPTGTGGEKSIGPPVVVMIASGGGSRAAVFTGLTFQALNADSEIAEVAENLHAISSVSGGSLANAAYIARLLALSKDPNKKSDAHSRKEALTDLFDALAGDFLWATMGGLVKKELTRGTAIEKEWREGKVNLGDYRISDLIKEWKATKGSKPPFPLPLFNTASLEGFDVVISPLDKHLYVQKPLHDHAAVRISKDNNIESKNYYLGIKKWDIEEIKDPDDEEPTWVFYRDGVYGLEDFLMKHNPLLAEAVRASANFPFGFPLVNVETKKYNIFSPQITEIELENTDNPQQIVEISLTDGGALSNSGMWSMYHLLMNNWEVLEKRGVLLIIVDAGKMPMPIFKDLAKKWNSLLGTIQDQSTIGQNLHRRMYDSLQLKYRDRLAVVKVDIIEKKYYNVMTTWSLDKESLRRIESSFNTTWPKRREEILNKWRILKEKQAPNEIKLINRRRPPAD
jgi:hypothetical protein